MVRLATFNVQHGRSAAGPVDVGLLARTCAALDADVLGLQEVERRSPRSHLADLPRAAATAAGAARVFAPVTRVGILGRYGNALLVRGAIADVHRLALPRPGRRERRGAVLATALVGERPLSVAVTHLGVDAVESTAQLAAVLEALLDRPPPRVLLGDLNRRPADLDLVAAAGLTIAGGPPSFPAAAPRARIDHVAVDGLRIVTVDVPATPVSDHRPVVVEAT